MFSIMPPLAIGDNSLFQQKKRYIFLFKISSIILQISNSFTQIPNFFTKAQCSYTFPLFLN